MKPTSLANLAIALVVAGWLMGVYGVLSQLGDPAPWVPKSVLEAQRNLSVAFMVAGTLSVSGSLWLSGYCYVHARKRSMLVLGLIIVPAIRIFASAFA